MQALTPHVYWAQRHGEIYLRVEISDAQVRKTCFGTIIIGNVFLSSFFFSHLLHIIYMKIQVVDNRNNKTG